MKWQMLKKKSEITQKGVEEQRAESQMSKRNE